MKSTLSILLLLCSLFATAQIVQIPDSNFKYYLLHHSNPVIDINHDNEIQTSEAWRANQLTIFGNVGSARPIYDIQGLEAFVYVQTLNLEIANDSLALPTLPRLTSFRGGGSVVTHFDASACTAIEQLTLSARLSNLDLRALPKLRGLSCPANILETIQFGNADSLRTINCGNNSFTSLDLRACRNLTTLDVMNCYYLTDLNLSGLSKMNLLYMSGVMSLRSLDLTGCAALQQLNTGIQVPLLEEIKLTGCTALNNVLCSDSKIQSLDFSSSPNLKYLQVTSQYLNHLNLKNGSALIYFDIRCRDSVNVCVDEFEADTLTQYFARSHAFTNISPYCSIYSGGNYNTIKGFVRVDVNANGCDTLDRGIAQVPVRFTDGNAVSTVRFSANNGEFVNYVYAGGFNLRPYFPYPYFTLSPQTANVSFDTANSITQQRDFCIVPTGSYQDVEVSFLPAWPPARPGFGAAYHLIFTNHGTANASGTLSIQYDQSRMSFDSASTAVTSQSLGQLSWNYSNLLPFETRTILVAFQMMAPPVNNIGDTLIYLADITPTTGDYTPDNNSFILPQTIRGAYDPNDKICAEGEHIDIADINKYLHYRINFQNEGTDTAFNIVITDQLSTKLDWNTVEILSSSFPVSLKQVNGKLEFIFNNIQLPHKAINEPASHGYVSFKVKPAATAVLGDSIKNTAAIYFDFNPPVITNTAVTVITNASVPVPVKLDYLSVNEIGSAHQLHWKVTCTSGSARFAIEQSGDGVRFTNIGQLSASALRCQLPFDFKVLQPLGGKNFYRIKITDGDGDAFYSRIVSLGKSIAGIRVLSVQAAGTGTPVLYYSSNRQQQVQVNVLQSDGRQFARFNTVMNAGFGNMALPVRHLPAGLYLITIQTNEGTLIQRWLK